MKYKNKNKVDKYTLREIKRQRREAALKGDGEYLWVNNTRGDLTLEKKPIRSPIPSSPCVIPPGQTFVGDNYFYKLMRSGEVRLVEIIKPAECERNETMLPEKKLILDQPNKFTNQGQTEHVVPDDTNKPLVENKPNNSQPVDKLITEDPLEGVEILLG